MKTNADLAREAERLSAKLDEAVSAASLPEGEGAHQGSAHRKLPETLRRELIAFRAALFDRGIYDPVLIRFDTASATQAATTRVAEQLRAIATSLAEPTLPG